LVISGFFLFANMTGTENVVTTTTKTIVVKSKRAAQENTQKVADKVSKGVNSGLEKLAQPATEAYSGIVNKTDQQAGKQLE